LYNSLKAAAWVSVIHPIQENSSMRRAGQDGASVIVLPHAVREAREFLNDGQYWHLVGLVRRLADFHKSSEIWDLDLKPIDQFWELRAKGSLLGRTNVRVYFADLQGRQEILILKARKKEEEGQLPRYVVINLEDRLSDYLAGFRKERLIVYRR
jgi:hypothetical protein